METQRLQLREMKPDDFQALSLVLGDAEAMRHYPYTFDGQHVRDWIERNMNRYRKDGFGLWAVCLKDTGEMIGDCGLTLQNINGEMLPEIGFHIRRDCQRKGYAKASISAATASGKAMPKRLPGPRATGRFGIRIIQPCTPTANTQMSLLSGRRNPSGCALPANIRMKSTRKRMYP